MGLLNVNWFIYRQLGSLADFKEAVEALNYLEVHEKDS
ncbi:MAG: Uncharacterised protein [Opitutia bacterium UBA7350]|nr:MAG: Uncharacterised protein [Opitutae bacterium UBA7350]